MLLASKLNFHRMTKSNPIFTDFVQRCGFSPLHRNTCTLQPVLSAGGAGLPSNPAGLQTSGLFSRCRFSTSPPEMQHCAYKVLSWELHTLQLQECMCFAHLSRSSAPPRAAGDLHPISSIPKTGNAAATEEREGAETSPPVQTPIAFARLFLPVSPVPAGKS